MSVQAGHVGRWDLVAGAGLAMSAGARGDESVGNKIRRMRFLAAQGLRNFQTSSQSSQSGHDLLFTGAMRHVIRKEEPSLRCIFGHQRDSLLRRHEAGREVLLNGHSRQVDRVDGGRRTLPGVAHLMREPRLKICHEPPNPHFLDALQPQEGFQVLPTQDNALQASSPRFNAEVVSKHTVLTTAEFAMSLCSHGVRPTPLPAALPRASQSALGLVVSA